MGYTTKYPLATGGVLDIALAAKSVVEDPCLYETATLLLHLNELEQGPSTPSVPTVPVKGIGLCKAVPIIKKLVWVRERPWAGALIVAGVIGGIAGIGYMMGKAGRK